jgi:hypothetical protein
MKLSAKVLDEPAEESAVRSLRSILPERTPSDYFEFLRKHDGAEFCFTDVDWVSDGYDSIRVFSVKEMIQMQKQDWLSSSLPKLLAIGTDSGGQFLAYDMRKSEPWPVVMYTPGSADALASTPVVDSISKLLTKYEDKRA